MTMPKRVTDRSHRSQQIRNTHASREPFTPEQLRDLGYRLGLDKNMVHGLGHEWDVADIMAVVEAWHLDQST